MLTSLRTATTATGSVALNIAPNSRHSIQLQSYGNVPFTRTAVIAVPTRTPGPGRQPNNKLAGCTMLAMPALLKENMPKQREV